MDTRSLTEEQLSTLIDENKYIYQEYFDLGFFKCLNETLVKFINQVYFRPVFIGFDPPPERVSPERPLIFAGNHSGMAFPWDAIVLISSIYRIYNYGKDACRPLTSPMLSQTALMNPFLMKNLWRKGGGVDATTFNFETMMRSPDFNVFIYPEGVPGIGKGFNKRYQLQRMSTSSLRMSLKYKTDIIPVATVNGEYINPGHYSRNWVNRLFNYIGIPFLPLGPLTPFLLLQPWLFYFAMPAKLTYVRGKRIKPYEMLDKPFEEVTRKDLEGLRDEIQVKMQLELDKAVQQYGQKPYQWKEFFRNFRKNARYFPYFMPFGWPLLFADFLRQYKRKGPDNIQLPKGILSTFRILVQNPFTIFYFIPILGWIPILIKGYMYRETKGKEPFAVPTEKTA